MRLGEEILHALIEVIEDLQNGGTILPRSEYEEDGATGQQCDIIKCG